MKWNDVIRIYKTMHYYMDRKAYKNAINYAII